MGNGKAGIANAAGVLAALLCASAAQAGKPVAAPFLQLIRASQAPIGFVEMCRDDRTFCSPSQTQPSGDGALVTGALKASAEVASSVVAPAAAWSQPTQTLSIRTDFQAVSLLAPLSVPAAPVKLPAFTAVRPLLLPEPVLAISLAHADASPSQSLFGDNKPLLTAAAPPPPTPAAAPIDLATREAPPPAADAVAARAERQLLRRVNRYVNARVRQETDMQAFGEEELWRRSGVGANAVGDCEDIAIEKRYELIGQGFAEDRLFFAVLYSHEAGLHTVLVARTQDGDMVLDSRTGFVLPWSRAGYSWISVQSTADPMTWYAVDAHSAQT